MAGGVVGLDIGGANLKAAQVAGPAVAMPFEVWRTPHELDAAIAELLGRFEPAARVAVTMTAELCDCYATKAEGVAGVLDAVAAALRRTGWPAEVRVWSCAGRLIPVAQARSDPLGVAAANWLALATWAGRWSPDGPAMVIDAGSTTIDLVPLRDGVPVPAARSDTERLACGELVYSGVCRTPVPVLVRSLELGPRHCRVAAELFATTRDVYTLLGDLPEDAADRATADGRPATREGCHARLARVVCADATLLGRAETLRLARQVAQAQLDDLHRAYRQVERSLGACAATVIVSGAGEFLARRLVERLPTRPRLLSLSERLGPERSSAACAHALAELALERWE